MSNYINKLKGDLYEIFILNHILDNKIYDQAWLCKDTPDDILIKADIDIKRKYFNNIRNDFGADIIATKNNKVIFIQCKNFEDTITIDNLAGFMFLIANYNCEGVLYYSGKLSTRIEAIKTNKVKYINLQFDNTHLALLNLKIDNFYEAKKDISKEFINNLK